MCIRDRYLQYEITLIRGSRGSMKGLFRSIPVQGFSIIQQSGCRYSMICMVFCTRASLPSKSRGLFAVVLAQLYSVHGGLAWMQSKCPGGKICGSQCLASATMVGSNFFSMSTEITSQPNCSKALPTDLVPQKSSRSLGIPLLSSPRSCDS